MGKTDYINQARIKLSETSLADISECESDPETTSTTAVPKRKSKAKRDSFPFKSGWDVFRMKYATDVRDEGFTGKDIASQLGDRWRKLTQIERNNFKFQAFTLKEVNRSP